PALSLARRARYWSARGPSAIGRQARHSGTRIRTDWPKSPSIRGARTAILGSRSEFLSRSSLKLKRGPHKKRTGTGSRGQRGHGPASIRVIRAGANSLRDHRVLADIEPVKSIEHRPTPG